MARKGTSARSRSLRREKTPGVLGTWVIVESPDWGRESCDGPTGSITFETDPDIKEGGRGQLQIGDMQAELDWRGTWNAGQAEFTWDGFEEGDQVFGRGKAWLDEDGRLHLEIWYHLGDEFNFVCEWR